MTPRTSKDWNPETYARFRGLRLRPALDLLMQIGTPCAGAVIDLGCGDGAVAAALRSRFPKREIVGIDSSAVMLAKARGYHRLIESDIASWTPDVPPAVIYSNAALHWLPDHAALMPRLARLLPEGGVLAVQMPRQQMAPSHVALREVSARLFPDRFDYSGWTPQVASPEVYARLLSPFGEVSVWQSEYLQRLPAAEGAHPVRLFTESTAMRPITEKLDAAEAARFVAAYEAVLSSDYPAEADGSVFFPFRRSFFVLTRH
jgi:trans-aconitate 2-methyltransferase